MSDEYRQCAATLARSESAASLASSLRTSFQGQYFMLRARPGPKKDLLLVGAIAGSDLRALTAAELQPVLARLADGPPAQPVEIGQLVLMTARGRPLLWQKPTHGSHWPSFHALETSLAELRRLAESYRAGMDALRQQVASITGVDEWRELSAARLHLVRDLVANALAWAGGGESLTLLLAGSATVGIGLVSDIDLLPIWATPADHGPAGCERLQRLITGLNACGASGDNLVARWSSNRDLALSQSDWPRELAASPHSCALAATLLFADASPKFGDATAFRASLNATPWRPPLHAWRRRWLSWWAEVEGKIRRTPQRARQVGYHLRRVSILREINAFFPGEDTAPIRDHLAWFRDALDPSRPRPVSATPIDLLWPEMVARLDHLAIDRLRAAGLSRWQGRIALAVARRVYPHRVPAGQTNPPVLLHPFTLG